MKVFNFGSTGFLILKVKLYYNCLKIKIFYINGKWTGGAVKKTFLRLELKNNLLKNVNNLRLVVYES